jgi:endonuclease/exonuclease/phosphatase family metal-dependent hydrolase
MHSMVEPAIFSGPEVRMRRQRAGVLIAVLILLTGLVGSGCTPGRPAVLTVMTRNLYLGGDITRPVRAATGRSGVDALLALGHANQELRDIVDRTDFTVRGRLLAGEIAAARPDLVGLQEVALWRHGPLQLDHLGRSNATEVDLDFLATLLADLDRREVGYRAVQVQQESDVEAPAFTGDPTTGSAGSARDVRLTVRDVLLVRTDSPVVVTASGSASYEHRLEVPLAGAAFSFVRGYAWADAVVGSVRFRFLTTHLESQSADLALAQAGEVLAGPAADRDRTTVLVCDCNSDPASGTKSAGQTVPKSAAYELLTGRGGFTDEWLALHPPPGPGVTGVLSELLSDATPAALDRRLDLVLARPARSAAVLAVHGDVTGDAASDRDPTTGLWPSDHAGVVLQLTLR